MSTPLAERRLQDVIAGKTQSATLTMRVNADDAEILVTLMAKGNENVTDILRRGMRRLAQEQWEEQLRQESTALADEDLNAEADAW